MPWDQLGFMEVIAIRGFLKTQMGQKTTQVKFRCQGQTFAEGFPLGGRVLAVPKSPKPRLGRAEPAAPSEPQRIFSGHFCFLSGETRIFFLSLSLYCFFF